MSISTQRTIPNILKRSNTVLINALRINWQSQILLLFMIVAGGHFAEHLVQLFQYTILKWPAREAGGVLGLWFPSLATSEYLHSTWNTLQFTGLILLYPLFLNKGKALLFWKLAIVAQAWHWLEHILLQVQYLTGYYLFHAVKQQSLLEVFFPRIELHFVYNLLSFTPTLIALLIYLKQYATTDLPEPFHNLNNLRR